jgi:cation:H+ antiporter
MRIIAIEELSNLVFTVLLLIGSAALIYVGCEFFVNGIEWVGRKLGIAQNAVGTVLAAFGTALPESVVTFVAVVFGATPAAKDIGVGAALGGPLVLATISYGLTGCAILLFRQRRSQGTELLVDGRRLARDQIAFLAIFFVKAALGFLIFPGKPLAGLLFLAAYAIYFWSELRQKAAVEEGTLQPLRFRPRTPNPSRRWVFIQTGLALGAVFVGSQVFVGELENLATGLGMPGHIMALLLSPVATELPETMNALIWVRQGKERLALANISGAMMIQATVPSALGLFYTPWLFDAPLALAAGVTTLAILYLVLLLRGGRLTASKLSFAALGYLAFAAAFLFFTLA